MLDVHKPWAQCWNLVQELFNLLRQFSNFPLDLILIGSHFTSWKLCFVVVRFKPQLVYLFVYLCALRECSPTRVWFCQSNCSSEAELTLSLKQPKAHTQWRLQSFLCEWRLSRGITLKETRAVAFGQRLCPAGQPRLVWHTHTNRVSSARSPWVLISRCYFIAYIEARKESGKRERNMEGNPEKCRFFQCRTRSSFNPLNVKIRQQTHTHTHTHTHRERKMRWNSIFLEITFSLDLCRIRQDTHTHVIVFCSLILLCDPVPE